MTVMTGDQPSRERALSALRERNRARHRGAYLYEDAQWMRDAYLTRGLTLRQVAAEAGCGLRTAARWMTTHGIPTRPASQYEHRKGENAPRWTGGRTAPCPSCGTPRSKPATTCMSCRDFSGEANPRWRGDAVKGPAMHRRIRAVRGKPSAYQCQHGCGRPATTWAYDHSDPAERSDPEGPFSLDVAHYMPLCWPCHKRFDLDYLRSS